MKSLHIIYLLASVSSSTLAFAIDMNHASTSNNGNVQMTANNSSQQEENPSSSSTNTNIQNEILQLPPSNPEDENIPILKFGETLRLEELGPIILNTDGTTRRIDNWNEMTEREKEVTWRRIKKRNEERRQVLMQQQQELEQQQSQSNDEASLNDNKSLIVSNDENHEL
jgi:predicted Fe-S protein YdhL (DUF1289 family)